ncbi:hypothetical protein [Bordetella trematum]|uniref:hypothetical protein n=1 Tax=Bordetella trematum TaxID=123899 RepID=UPI00126A1E7C|nr:hypothetical protein [Bordetella trematum]
MAYTPETMAASGAVVTLDHAGEVIVHRGLLRSEDAKAIAQAAHAERAGDNDGDADGQDSEDGKTEAAPAKTLSEWLVRNLSAQRTAALQVEVAKKPDVALAALVHRLALTVFYHGGDSLLQIAAHSQVSLAQHAPELAEGQAAAEFDALRTAWRERLPADDTDLFDALRQMKRADLLALLAVCVAGTVDAVLCSEHDTRADALAQAVRLDTSAYWQPSAEAYFLHVPKAQALAWFQVHKPAELNRVAGYKKLDLAREAQLSSSASRYSLVLGEAVQIFRSVRNPIGVSQ